MNETSQDSCEDKVRKDICKLNMHSAWLFSTFLYLLLWLTRFPILVNPFFKTQFKWFHGILTGMLSTSSKKKQHSWFKMGLEIVNFQK